MNTLKSAERIVIDDVEEWVDTVLDEYEARAWDGYSSWHSYACDRYALPPRIDRNFPEFDAELKQDVMVWLHDGGLTPREVATVLHLSPNKIGRTIAKLSAEYEDEDEE